MVGTDAASASGAGGTGQVTVSNGGQVSVGSLAINNGSATLTGLGSAVQTVLGGIATVGSGATNPSGPGQLNIGAGTTFTSGGVFAVQNGGTVNMAGGLLSLPRGRAGAAFTVTQGTFNLGDINGTGTISEAGAGSGVSMTVDYQNGGAGTFHGWGMVGLSGNLTNNGRVVADGYGIDRTLDLSGFISVLNTIPNPAAGGTNGWFAQGHGELLLPARRSFLAVARIHAQKTGTRGQKVHPDPVGNEFAENGVRRQGRVRPDFLGQLAGVGRQRFEALG